MPVIVLRLTAFKAGLLDIPLRSQMFPPWSRCTDDVIWASIETFLIKLLDRVVPNSLLDVLVPIRSQRFNLFRLTLAGFSVGLKDAKNEVETKKKKIQVHT